MKIPDYFSENFETAVFRLKILTIFDADQDPGSGISLTLDPGSRKEKFGYGINIPDPQHWEADTSF
jgi:hypothetical protein